MNYYVARDCPYPMPKTGGMIGFSHATAKGWDVKYIMGTASEVPIHKLYRDEGEDNSSFYLQKTDKATYDVLDAVGVPHMDKAGHEVRYSCIPSINTD